jgi:excisionase family DNA binding protein
MQTQATTVEADHAVLPRNEILALISAPNAPLYMLSTQEAAQALGLQKQTLETWRSQSRGPKFVRLGALVRYRSTDLLAWLEAQVEG